LGSSPRGVSLRIEIKEKLAPLEIAELHIPAVLIHYLKFGALSMALSRLIIPSPLYDDEELNLYSREKITSNR
jgi:hypothetical protein